jgi:arylsulfatase A-like enzyme
VNAIVYISDALRPDHLGCYGARFMNTATIDGFAAEGVRFDQVITAAAWTAPAMTSIATGLYPHHHGVFDWGNPLAPDVETLFHSFARAGHSVGSFVFDDDYLFKGIPEAGVEGRSEDFDQVLAWLAAHADRPFLLVVHSWATHMPYNVSHRERRTWKSAKAEFIDAIRSGTAEGVERCREAYRQAVEYQSETLFASLLEQVDGLGLRDSTAIAFGADHGESWGERYPDKHMVQGMYHLHGAELYDEILRVPLIIRAPGLLDPTVVAGQVRTVDIAPTLRELASLPQADCDGISLVAAARAEERVDRLAVSITSDRGNISRAAVRRPPWKLVRDLQTGAEQAFRLDLDPREREDRCDSAPQELRDLLESELAAVDRRVISDEEEQAIEARLSDLGYL